MTVRTLDDLDISRKRVLVRADLNVPLKNSAVGDTARIEACAPTIREVVDRGGTPIVISHLGRPKGKRVPSLSLRPVANELGKSLDGIEIVFADDCVGSDVKAVVGQLKPGQVALLENLRFHHGETENDPDFAAALAGLADVYIDDAFSAAHRAHASIVGVAERLPAAAGRLMQRELENLERLLAEPREPYLAILAGAKVETKLDVTSALLRKGADVVLGGGMANTVLLAQGREIGKSICEKRLIDMAAQLRSTAEECQRELILPVDAIVGPNPESADQARTVSVDDVPQDAMILDVGPRTVDEIIKRVNTARTVVWNGPLGVTEQDTFAEGTLAVARAIAERTESHNLVSVVGGGDTVAVLRSARLIDRFTYASMAGGAFLAWLKGTALPGLEVLMRRKEAPARRAAGE